VLDLDCLFPKSTMPRDGTDSLQAIGDLLMDLSPGMVMLCRSDGQVMAVDASQIELDEVDIATLEEALPARLAAKRFDTWEQDFRVGTRQAFALRLPFETRGAILAGHVALSETASDRLHDQLPAMMAAGRLAWRVLDRQAALDRVNARNNQLKAEYDTLREAHTQAVAQALDEQQKRIESERLQSRQLEKIVAERSAALQASIEEAQRQKEELERYSAALQASNQALEEFSRAAESANRAKSEFLANMSHELRTPLTAILGHCEILQEDLPESPHQESLDVIERNGRHLLNLINDVLDLAKIEAGKLDMERIQCSPHEMMICLEQMFLPRVLNKPVKLSMVQETTLPLWMESDPTRLQQILMNLLSNAIKFTEQGEVKLVVRYQAEQPGRRASIVFAVADTGIGIPPEKLQKVFEPFEQADMSTARRFGGTGLGLSISRRLAERLGGRIDVESRIGYGSTFQLTLPCAVSTELVTPDQWRERQSKAVKPTAEHGEPDVPLTLNARVLLAEDSPDNRRLIIAILTRAGAEVTVMENGLEVVELLYPPPGSRQPRGHFDIVLMDMQMPVMDGYQATRRLRERGCLLPIVALTAHAMKGDRELCLEAGCDDYTTKPIDRTRLLKVLRRQLERRIRDW